LRNTAFSIQVIFDSDPAPAGVAPAQQVEMMSQAMIRGVMDESGEQFVAYFLPTDETLLKRQEDFQQVSSHTYSDIYVPGILSQ
jgi:RNA polymerase II-associated factor 1